jgi:thiamine phosphate synthase YjbQ (UPF0047 family)
MKTLTQEIWMDVPQRRAIVSIHDQVVRLVEDSAVQDGLVLVNTYHAGSLVLPDGLDPRR